MTTSTERAQLNALDSISDYAGRLHHIEQSVAWSVYEARTAGLSWAQIAKPLGVSKQAAQQKYTRWAAAHDVTL